MAPLCSHTSSCHCPSPDAYECMLYGHLIYYSFNNPHCWFLHGQEINTGQFLYHQNRFLYSALHSIFNQFITMKLYRGGLVLLLTQHYNTHLCWFTLPHFLGCLRDNLTITDQWQSHRSLATTTAHSMHKTLKPNTLCVSNKAHSIYSSSVHPSSLPCTFLPHVSFFLVTDSLIIHFRYRATEAL